jgi:PAS domain-containing protein
LHCAYPTNEGSTDGGVGAYLKIGIAMRSQALTRIVPGIFDAALTPELWPDALHAIAEAAGPAGAGYLVRNKRTARIEWISWFGPSAEFKADYVSYYAALSPYRPLLDNAPRGTWLRLSKCLPQTVLRTDEWYNDFLVRAGVSNILGIRLFDDGTHSTIFGFHRGLKNAPNLPRAAQLQELYQALSKAAHLQHQLQSLRWKSSVGLRALDQLAAGVIVTDSGGRVIEMNRAAERIVRIDDGLTIRSARLGARCPSDDTKLAKFIAAAAAEKKALAAVSRMIVGRDGGQRPYVLTVSPLSGELAVHNCPGDGDSHRPGRAISNSAGLGRFL